MPRVTKEKYDHTSKPYRRPNEKGVFTSENVGPDANMTGLGRQAATAICMDAKGMRKAENVDFEPLFNNEVEDNVFPMVPLISIKRDAKHEKAILCRSLLTDPHHDRVSCYLNCIEGAISEFVDENILNEFITQNFKYWDPVKAKDPYWRQEFYDRRAALISANTYIRGISMDSQQSDNSGDPQSGSHYTQGGVVANEVAGFDFSIRHTGLETCMPGHFLVAFVPRGKIDEKGDITFDSPEVLRQGKYVVMQTEPMTMDMLEKQCIPAYGQTPREAILSMMTRLQNVMEDFTKRAQAAGVGLDYDKIWSNITIIQLENDVVRFLNNTTGLFGIRKNRTGAFYVGADTAAGILLGGALANANLAHIVDKREGNGRTTEFTYSDEKGKTTPAFDSEVKVKKLILIITSLYSIITGSNKYIMNGMKKTPLDKKTILDYEFEFIKVSYRVAGRAPTTGTNITIQSAALGDMMIKWLDTPVSPAMSYWNSPAKFQVLGVVKNVAKTGQTIHLSEFNPQMSSVCIPFKGVDRFRF